MTKRKYTGKDIRRKELEPFLPCKVCGSTFGLEIDHIDENPNNNDQSNLQTLCGYHHRQKTQYGPNEIMQLMLKIEKDPRTKKDDRLKSLEYHASLPPGRSKYDLETDEQLEQQMLLVASKMAKLEAQKARLNSMYIK